MMCRKGLAAALLAAATAPLDVLAAEGPAAGWPSRPLRMLVPFAAGGAVDTTGRLIALRLAESLGRPVLVENRPGAAGMIGIEALLKAPADGYTLFVGAAGVLATTPAGQETPRT
jgi:tripartite-type tricarboxylate transporter receptor subunit TctC